MGNDELWKLSLSDQAQGIAAGDWTSEELVSSVLGRIDGVNGTINAYCTLNERALDEARRVDLRRSNGEPLGVFAGVPFSVKDLIPTSGVRTTLGSLAHRDWMPETDELAVSRLREAGAIVVGKTNTRELGYGIVTDNLLFGPTRNPWNTAMTAAGSSGGAAAAVAAGMGSLAIGSDGGGSLRVPSSLCGAVTIKPTFGLVPMYPSCRTPLRAGLDGWGSLECIGPITPTVDDCERALTVMARFDAADRYAVPYDGPSLRPDPRRTVGSRVFFSEDLGIAEVAPEVRKAVRDAVECAAEEWGWSLTEKSLELPTLTQLRNAFAVTVAADSDLDGLRRLADRFPVSEDIRELVSRDWALADLVESRRLRQRAYECLAAVTADVLITPVTATGAFPIGLRFPHDAECGVGDGRQWSPFAFLANLTGQPAASVPARMAVNGTPLGVQIIGRRFEDRRVLDFARAFEQASPQPRLWELCEPPSSTPWIKPGLRRR